MLTEPTELLTKRLYLRWMTADDARLMLAIWNDPDFVRHVGDRGIRNLRDAQTALEDSIVRRYAQLGFGPYRVARRYDDRAMGICGLFQRDYLSLPDLGFCLLPRYRRQGFTEEASRAVLGTVRCQLKLPRIAAIVADGNQASISLVRKLGGLEVASFGDFVTMNDAASSQGLHTDARPANPLASVLLFEIRTSNPPESDDMEVID